MGLLDDIFNAGAGLVDDAQRFAASRRLVEAAKAGKLADVRLRLAEGADINKRDGDGNTALMAAVQQGALDIVEFLMAKGAGLSYRNKNGNTALIEAVRCDRPEIARYLLEHGANINECNSAGSSPLHLAVEYNRPQMAVIIMNRDPNLNRKNRDGDTPLILAVRRNRVEIAWRLLEKGADPDIKDRTGKALIDIPAGSYQSELKDMLTLFLQERQRAVDAKAAADEAEQIRLDTAQAVETQGKLRAKIPPRFRGGQDTGKGPTP